MQAPSPFPKPLARTAYLIMVGVGAFLALFRPDQAVAQVSPGPAEKNQTPPVQEGIPTLAAATIVPDAASAAPETQPVPLQSSPDLNLPQPVLSASNLRLLSPVPTALDTVPNSVTPVQALEAQIPGTPAPTTTAPNRPLAADLNPSNDPLSLPTRPEQVRVGSDQPLTLVQVQELAARNNRTLQIAELQLRQARAALRQAQSSLYPSLSFQSDFTHAFRSSAQLNLPNPSLQQQGQLQQVQISQLQQQIALQQQQGQQQLQLRLGQLQQRFQGPQLTNATDQQNLEVQQQIQQLQTSFSQVVNQPFPQVVTLAPLVSSSGRGGQGGGGAGSQSTTVITHTLSLNYTIFNAGARSASIRSAREQVRLAELTLQQQQQQLRLDITLDYYNAQQADAQVQIARAAVDNARVSLRDTEALERAGLGTRFDVLQSQVLLANALQNQTQALSLQRITRRQLAQRLSLSEQAGVVAADPIAQAEDWRLPVGETILLAFQNRVELEQSLAQRNIAIQGRRLALAALGPQVNLFANVNTFDSLFDSFAIRPGYAIGIQMNFPLFEGGAARASAARQSAGIALAETQFANTKNQIRLQVEQALFSLQANQSSLQTSQLAVTQATEALRLARLRFQAGVGTQADVTGAQSDLTRAQGNLLAAILDYNRALATLKRAVGYAGPATIPNPPGAAVP